MLVKVTLTAARLKLLFCRMIYSVTPKPDRQIFVNNEKINKKYQLLMVRFIKVIHPPGYGEI